MENSEQIDLPVNLSPPTAQESERHTGEIQDIITKVPSWVIRWGIMVFFGVLLIVLSIAAIVRYPDVVKGRMRFQPLEADRLVVTDEPALIRSVAVKQGEFVRAGQVLAVLQNKERVETNLVSPITGKVGFVVLAQPGNILQPQQPLFVVHPPVQHFLGVIQIPVSTIEQVKVGQTVIITLGDKQGQASDELKGKIKALTDEPDKNGMITAQVMLDNPDQKNLKTWTTGDAQILTKNISVAQRIWSSIIKKI